MSLNMIFNSNDTDTALDGDTFDTISVLACINDFFARLRVTDIDININKIQSIISGMKLDFPHVDGLDKASPFKKAANFLCYFVAESPILTKLPDSFKNPDTEMGRMLLKLRHDPTNAIIGFFIVTEALHGANLECPDRKNLTLQNKIQLSNHSYVDTIGALSQLTPRDFPLIAVLLEQMAYKTNPDCQYPITP